MSNDESVDDVLGRLAALRAAQEQQYLQNMDALYDPERPTAELVDFYSDAQLLASVLPTSMAFLCTDANAIAAENQKSHNDDDDDDDDDAHAVRSIGIASGVKPNVGAPNQWIIEISSDDEHVVDGAGVADAGVNGDGGDDDDDVDGDNVNANANVSTSTSDPAALIDRMRQLIVDREAELRQAHEAEQQAPLISNPRALLVALEQVLVERRLQLAGTIEEQLTSQRLLLNSTSNIRAIEDDLSVVGAQLRLLRAQVQALSARAKQSRAALKSARSMRESLVGQDRSVALRRLIDERIESTLAAKVDELRRQQQEPQAGGGSTAPADRADALLNSIFNDRGGETDMDISTESGEVEAPPPPPQMATSAPEPDDDDDELAALRAAVLESTMRAPSPLLKRKLSPPESAPPPPPPPQPVWSEPSFDTVRNAIVGVNSAARLDSTTTAAAPVVYRLGDYESPLAYFRAYRLSPHFRLMTGCKVSDMSYSHRIDPHKTLCRFDVDGVCNDSGCAWQHWREMSVSAVQLVRQLVAYTAYGEEQFGDVLEIAQRQQAGGDLDAVARRTVARIHELNAMVEEGEEKADGGDGGDDDRGVVWRARKQARV